MFYLIDNLNPTAQVTSPYSQWGYWGIPDALPQPPRVITVHTAENTPDLVGTDGGAEAVARFFAATSRRASVHKVIDSDSIIDLLPDTHRAIHSKSAWQDSLSFEKLSESAKLLYSQVEFFQDARRCFLYAFFGDDIVDCGVDEQFVDFA